MDEQVFQSSCGITLKYVFRSGCFDAKTLIVIFSGFGRNSPFTYDFQGESLVNCHSNILWIKDEVNGQASFYINIVSDSLENSIIELIKSLQQKYGIANEETLFLGASKGGFAAIYYALKMKIPYVIASAPIVELGSFLKLKEEQMISVCVNICGGGLNADRLEKLNAILYRMIKECSLRTSFYLFSSPSDDYENCDLMYATLKSNKNIKCNRLVAKTKAVYQHTAVTKYFRYFISSLCNIFSYCSQLPSLDTEEIVVNDKMLPNFNPDIEPVAELTAVSQDGIFLNFKGVAFLKGVECSSYDSYSKYISFIKGDNEYSIQVGATKNKELSAKYYEGNYIDYSAGGFSTFKNAPVDTSMLTVGDYYINAKIFNNETNETFQCPVLYNKKPIVVNTGHHFVVITELAERCVLRKVNYLSEFCPDFFQIAKFNINNKGILSIVGSFIVRSQNLQNWGSLTPYLILRELDIERPIENCFKLAQKTLHSNVNSTGEIGDYCRASFSDAVDCPINLSTLRPGKYEMTISSFVNSFLYSKTFGVLAVTENGWQAFVNK